MKIAYFDCFSGISGDMLIGALLDAGAGFEDLKRELSGLNLPGYSVTSAKTSRRGISGTRFLVSVSDDKTSRKLGGILSVIEKSTLKESIKKSASDIFLSLAEAEGGIHGRPPDEVHFHEIGGIDCIVDVVGALVCLELLGIEKVFCSAINTGSGFVDACHGMLPVPSPAALELLRGVPVYSSGVKSELATPTGVAVIRHAASAFGEMPPITPSKIGYGAGERELSHPNLLRVLLGECAEDLPGDRVLLIETNIDNMNPEFFGRVFDILQREGALDVFLTPVIMKKQRPGTKLGVICREEDSHKLSGIIFRETSAIGVRYSSCFRRKLEREVKQVDTPYGKVRVKFSYYGGEAVSVSPEYDDCVMLAEKFNAPVKKIYEQALKGAGNV